MVERDGKKNSPEYYVIIFSLGIIINQHFQPATGIMECAIVQDSYQHKALLHSERKPSRLQRLQFHILINIIIIIIIIILQSPTRIQVVGKREDNTEHIGASTIIGGLALRPSILKITAILLIINNY